MHTRLTNGGPPIGSIFLTKRSASFGYHFSSRRARSAMAEAEDRDHQLVLYFDVNKTLVMSDMASDVGL